MDTAQKIDILDDACKAFFKALLAGYAGGEDCAIEKEVHKKTVTMLIQLETGTYTVIDSWWTTPHSNRSAGTTTVLLERNPVWWMSYGGEYPEHIIPFLKSALAWAYKDEFFYGGRGPDEFVAGNLVYKNFPVKHGFDDFAGREEIFVDGVMVGFHEYWGISLI
jgi:hypothetical protein